MKHFFYIKSVVKLGLIGDFVIPAYLIMFRHFIPMLMHKETCLDPLT